MFLKKVQSAPEAKQNPFASAGIALALPMIDGAVNSLVNKDSIQMLLNGQIKKRTADDETTPKTNSEKSKLRAAKLRYINLNETAATLKSADDKTTVLRFKRQGFAQWKLKAIELPLDDIAP